MSGTASRFQGRFGYAPGMRAAQSSAMQPGGLPMAPTPATSAPVSQAPAAPLTPEPATPVSAGAMAMPVDRDGVGSARGDEGAPYGEPGSLAGLGGLFGSYGMGLGTLSGLAGLAAGVPGLGLAGTAAGTAMDVSRANEGRAEMGLPNLSFGPAFANNMTFGLLGQSLTDQDKGVIGAGPVTAENSFDLTGQIDAQYGPVGDPGKSDTPSDGGNKSDTSGDVNADNPFMAGGYTGAGKDGRVQPHKPAGTVHEGEVVIPAHQVARYGLPTLMALARGDAQPSKLAMLVR